MTTETTLDRRGLLLAAASMLADRVDPLTATPATLAAALGIGEQEFDAEFDGLESYFAAVQLGFFESRLAAVIGKAASMKPGMDRIRSAWDAYLDHSLTNAAVHAWFRRAQQRYPALIDEQRRRNHGMLLMIQIEFSNMGCPHPLERARLAIGMVLETVKFETEMRSRNEAMRDLLWACIETFARC